MYKAFVSVIGTTIIYLNFHFPLCTYLMFGRLFNYLAKYNQHNICLIQLIYSFAKYTKQYVYFEYKISRFYCNKALLTVSTNT